MKDNKKQMSKEELESILTELKDYVDTEVKNNLKETRGEVSGPLFRMLQLSLRCNNDLKEIHKRELKESYMDGYEDGEFEAEGRNNESC